LGLKLREARHSPLPVACHLVARIIEQRQQGLGMAGNLLVKALCRPRI